MGGNGKSKYWSAGTLKSRGWTEKLIEELLPKCRHMNYYGKRVRTWDKLTVLKAEEDERFKASVAARQERKQVEHREWCAEADEAIVRAIEFLNECWGQKDEPSHGVVIAVGPGKTEDGKLVPVDLKEGQRVIYKKYSGTEVKNDGRDYLLIKAEDILAIVE